MPDDFWLLPLTAAIVFLGSLVYGLTGFGADLVTIPLTTQFTIGMRVAAFAITGLLLKSEVWVMAALAV